MVSAVLCAVCYGVATPLQAVAARATSDDRAGVDPGLLVKLLGQWRYVLGLGLDVLGFLTQLAALRSLPLFVVQAVMSGSIAVTAVIAARWFRMTLSVAEWSAVAVMCLGLALLGLSAKSEGTGHAGFAFHLGLLVAAVVFVLAGLAAGRLPTGPRTALLGLVSGLGFGVVGIAGRVIPSLAPGVLVTDPATYAVIVAGVVGALFYATAMQRGGVVAATAMMVLGETVLPAIIGVTMLGDQARSGWQSIAVGGFVLAVASAVLLARFGSVEQSPPRDGAAQSVGVGSD
jgi:drug/metabolite transporter (DMT)-like permease